MVYLYTWYPGYHILYAYMYVKLHVLIILYLFNLLFLHDYMYYLLLHVLIINGLKLRMTKTKSTNFTIFLSIKITIPIF